MCKEYDQQNNVSSCGRALLPEEADSFSFVQVKDITARGANLSLDMQAINPKAVFKF